MGLNFAEKQRQEKEMEAQRKFLQEGGITPEQHANIAVAAAIREIALNPKANGYARGYAETYFSLHHQFQGDELKEAKRIQIKYILSNITHLRGNRIPEIRQLLKEASK